MRIVELHEPITEDMFMRPLLPESENLNIQSGMLGEPTNSFLWIPVLDRLGYYWMGTPLSDFMTYGEAYIDGEWYNIACYEFAVDVPKAHARKIRKERVKQLEFLKKAGGKR